MCLISQALLALTRPSLQDAWPDASHRVASEAGDSAHDIPDDPLGTAASNQGDSCAIAAEHPHGPSDNRHPWPTYPVATLPFWLSDTYHAHSISGS